jgi:hypothetical protein
MFFFLGEQKNKMVGKKIDISKNIYIKYKYMPPLLKLWERWWHWIVLASFIFSLCLTAHRLPLNATTQLIPFMPSKPELGNVPATITYDYFTVF